MMPECYEYADIISYDNTAPAFLETGRKGSADK